MDDLLEEYGLSWDKRDEMEKKMMRSLATNDNRHLNLMIEFRVSKEEKFYEKMEVTEAYQKIPRELMDYVYVKIYRVPIMGYKAIMQKRYFMKTRHQIEEMDIEEEIFVKIRNEYRLKEIFDPDKANDEKIMYVENKIIDLLEMIKNSEAFEVFQEKLSEEFTSYVSVLRASIDI